MDPFIGQIMMFGGNFAPRGWALCNGQLLEIISHSALFSLLGTTYGGDGRTTFGLPDLRGRIPMHMGDGPGLTERRLGSKSGEERVTLTTNQIPSHNHSLRCTDQEAKTADPAGQVPSKPVESSGKELPAYGPLGDTDGAMANEMCTNTGGGQAHNNMQPYQVVNFCIALTGVYPSRN